MTAPQPPHPADPAPAEAPAEPRLLRIWASAELAVASFFLVVIFGAVLWQVISRYVPSLNWPGVGELANYSLIVLTFIMVGYLIGKNGHITIQVIDYLVRGRAFTVVRAVSALCVAAICALLVWEAYALMLAYPYRRTAALEIPVWLLYLVPLVGFASGTVRALVNILTAARPESRFDAAEAK
ncbi:TRAP transporter small permease subunit [Catellatospora sp. NPDC049609]|uniref:TRAP transporter small permease n=1 Tax=Catellatospora sp. NPDC049609 TaxID=3155505 RepID=UPI00343C05E8